MTETLALKNLSVNLGGKAIVREVSFSLQRGEIACLLGPSGCGKTTLLRAIAGFEQPQNGEIHFQQQLLSSRETLIPVERRRIGMVFQDYALFPHLSVRQNIAFGLKKSESLSSHRVAELSALLEIDEFLDEYPHRLSGGQQQRVAIARAMAPRPEIILLDEPFASMDVELREQLAKQIRSALKKESVTAILVSHNQLEAFAMADHIGVMKNGQLLQWDTAFQLYHQPANSIVADFIGEGSLIAATATDSFSVDTQLGTITSDESHGFEPGASVAVLIRPDDIIHNDDSQHQLSVVDKAFRGAEFLYTLQLPDGDTVLSLVPSHHDHAIGEAIGIELHLDHLVVFPGN